MITNETNLSPEEKWQRATIANNFIFYKIMHENPDVCKHLLEILLEIEIDHIEMANEEQLQVDYESKGVRLDVYAKNQDYAFDVEMQAVNTNELEKRSRYYQGVIDVDNLKSGQLYRELKTSYVIFICIDDIFNCGLPVYSFENLCREDNKIKLNDMAYKYFFIAKNCDKLLNAEQKSFLKLVTENKPSDNFTREIINLVNEAKTKVGWRKQFMDWEREKAYQYEAGIKVGIKEGIEQGQTAKSVEAALVLINKYSISPEEACESIGAPLDVVKEKLAK